MALIRYSEHLDKDPAMKILMRFTPDFTNLAILQLETIYF